MRSPDLRCAFLTMGDTSGWSIDADLAFAPLAGLGWQAEWLPWRRAGVDWDAYDAVYLAATWDYPEDPAAFLAVLEAVDASRALLVNPLELVRWNIPKTYLKDLEAGGAPIVPSRFYECFADCDLDENFAAPGVARLIVKPVVSTNANDTYLLTREQVENQSVELAATFGDRPFVVQPFLEAVRDEGEYSLFYIGDGFSHGIRKIPKAGDFRVQEERGAAIEATSLTPELLAAGERVIELVDPAPLYGRCDFLRDAGDVLRVMELELIEPSLYLRTDDEAPRRFAVAFDQYNRLRRTL